MIRFHVRSPVRLLDYTVPCRKLSPSFILYGSMSEVQSVFYMIRFHVRSPVRLLYYTVPCRKSSPSFILYVPCRKSSPSFILYGSMSEVQSVFCIIRFHVGSPVRLLFYTVPCQKSSPSFKLYGSMSEVQSVFYAIRSMSEVQFVFYIIRFHVRSPVRLLDYTVPCQKPSPSFILYGYVSEVQSVF